MKTINRSFKALLCLLAFFNCAATVSPTPKAHTAPTLLSAQSFKAKALAHENNGNLRRALLAWQIAATIKSDPRAQQAIDDLKHAIAAEAEVNFKSGLSYYRSGKMTKARNAFLKTIRVAPTHKGARYYLKKRLHMTKQTAYKVRRGDSYSKIAAQIYGDPKKAYLIAYFNDLDPLKPLLTGVTLFLPVLDTRTQKFKPNINAWEAKAKKALKEKKYDTALAYTAKIKKTLSGHPKALQIADEANFAKASALMADHQYLSALKHFKQVRPSFKGRNKAISQARRHLLKQALEEKMTLAETHLEEKSYERAIHVTEEVLEQYPNNARARAIHDESHHTLAKQLLDGGEPAAAVELLEKTDPGYKNTEMLLSLARARVKSQAEKHYRKGVNHFINEDLEKAIHEWQQALALNPEHPKASQDIENASRLLEKYQTLESKP